MSNKGVAIWLAPQQVGLKMKKWLRKLSSVLTQLWHPSSQQIHGDLTLLGRCRIPDDAKEQTKQWTMECPLDQLLRRIVMKLIQLQFIKAWMSCLLTCEFQLQSSPKSVQEQLPNVLLVFAIILSLPNYSNAAFTDVSKKLSNGLIKIRRVNHICPFLRSLYWLSGLLLWTAHNSKIIWDRSPYCPYRVKTKHGAAAISFYRPYICNKLPENRRCSSILTFGLKSFVWHCIYYFKFYSQLTLHYSCNVVFIFHLIYPCPLLSYFHLLFS